MIFLSASSFMNFPPNHMLPHFTGFLSSIDLSVPFSWGFVINLLRKQDSSSDASQSFNKNHFSFKMAIVTLKFLEYKVQSTLWFSVLSQCFTKYVQQKKAMNLHTKFSIAKQSLEKLIETMLKEFPVGLTRIFQVKIITENLKGQHSVQSLPNNRKLFSAEWAPEHILRNISRLNG